MNADHVFAAMTPPDSGMPSHIFACNRRWRCLFGPIAAIVLAVTGPAWSQQKTPQIPTTPESGYMRVLLRPTHSPVFDAQHRPITAGGFIDGAPIVFEDITRQSGLDKFRHRSGTPEKSTIIEVPGSGVAMLDYHNDGWLDIYLLNGSTLAALKGKEPAPRATLFHNNHDGTFTEVTERAGGRQRVLGIWGCHR